MISISKNDDSVPEQPLVLGLSLLNLRLTRSQIEQCLWLSSELLVWNAESNLTGITDPLQAQARHLLDSLTAVPVLRRVIGDQGGRLADVGSGAGFPGLPIKLALPKLQVTMIEAHGKKAAFISHAVTSLRLDGAEWVHGRAEVLGRDPEYRGRFDAAIARAVGSVSTLAELLLPLLRLGGWALLMKTMAGLNEELDAAVPAIEMLGGRVDGIVPTPVPGFLDDRAILLILSRFV